MVKQTLHVGTNVGFENSWFAMLHITLSTFLARVLFTRRVSFPGTFLGGLDYNAELAPMSPSIL